MNIDIVNRISNAYRILVWNSLGKCPHRRRRRRQEDKSKMDFGETGCESGILNIAVRERVQ
jgi:hypothetical protein